MSTLAYATGGYTPSAILTSLQASGRTLNFQYEWLDSNNQTLGFLPNVMPGGSIDHQYLSAIKRSCSLTFFQAADPGYNFAKDRVRIWVGVLMPDGNYASFAKGVFLMSAPTLNWSGGLATYAATGYDQTLVLSDDLVSQRYTIPSGTLYTDALLALLSGIPSSNVVEHEATLSADKSFLAGTSKLTIVQWILTSLNYGTLWFDGYGVAQCSPYVEPANATVEISYDTTLPTSMVQNSATYTEDLSEVPNVITISASNQNWVMTSTFTNTDPNSPVSTVSRGRKITYVDSTQEIATQQALDAAAKKIAIGYANVYGTANFSTPIMPIHEDRDTLFLNHIGLGLSDVFSEIEWKMDLIAGGSMAHTVRRIVNLDGALVGTPIDTSN